MTVQVRKLPLVPRGVDVKDLGNNGKLYSDEEMREIKARFVANGRYRTYEDENGHEQRLRYPVFVYDGRYFAAYPGKKLILGKSQSAGVKVAQDFDSGVWVAEKVLRVDFDIDKNFVRDDIENEAHCLADNQQVILADATKRAVNFYRPFSDVDKKNSEEGKYYLFSNYATGMDVGRWVKHNSDMPLIIKLDIAISLVDALNEVHTHQVLHRDVKPANAVFDIFKEFDHAVSMIDFGLSVKMNELDSELYAGWGTPPFEAPEIRKTESQDIGKYSVKSDIYALGVTLGIIFGAMEMTKTGDVIRQLRLSKVKDESANTQELLDDLIDDMMVDEADQRLELNAVLQQLTEIRDKLSNAERVMNVCMLDVDRIIAERERGEHSYENFLRGLKGYHVIRLCVSDRACNDAELLAIKHELEVHRFIVADDVCHGSSSELADYANDRVNHVNGDGRIYQLEYLAQHAVLEERDEVVNQFLLPEEPREGQRVFSRIAMQDNITTALEREEAAESYDMVDFLFSVFDAARERVCAATLSALQCGNDDIESAGCFGLFANMRPVNRAERSVFEAPVGSDSESDERLTPRAMARY